MTAEPFDRRLEDADPLDVQLGAPPVAASGRWMRSRLALGLSPTPRPGLVLLLAGMAIGPHGLRILSPAVLSFVDPAVSMALAALGAFVGLDLRVRRPREQRLLLAASIESAVTLVVVAAGVLAVHLWVGDESTVAPWLLAVILGCCAASSAAPVHDEAVGNGSTASRIGELDDLVPIVVGGMALAAMHSATSASVLRLTGEAAGVAAIIAAGCWLLVAQTSVDSEQRVFSIGSLLLLGGSAAYLSVSALVSGLVGGVLWNVAGGAARDRIERDLRYLQHPLLALLLVVAGASMEPSPGILLFGALYVVLRVIGKIAGGWLGGQLAGRGVPRDLGRHLVAPGIVAIAFAVNAAQRAGESVAATALGIAVIGSLGSEVLTLVARPRRQAA